MPPEQARGEAIDRRADVYALGATLAHVLTGKAPFAGVEPTIAIDQVSRGESPPLVFPDEVPGELIAIVSKAMLPSRDARYADAGELAADLRRFVAGQLVAAHVYTLRERFVRWLRKHRLAVAIAAVAVIALATVSTMAIRSVIEARTRAADRADDMLVERAYQIAPTDPVHAIALLAQLPAGSRKWDRAYVAAETAAAFGVGWGMPLVDTRRAMPRVIASPKGDVLAVTSEENLYLVEPSLMKPARVVFTAAETLSQPGWIDDDSVVAISNSKPPQLLRIHRDGRSRVLDTAGKPFQLATPRPDGRLFAILDKHLRELDPNGGPPGKDYGEAILLERFEGGLVYSQADQLVIHADDREPVRLPYNMREFRITVDLARGRIALFKIDEVIEFERGDATWTERGRWAIDASYLVYYETQLLAVEGDGISYLVPGKPPIRYAAAINRTGALIVDAVSVSSDGLFIAGDRAIFYAGSPDARLSAIAPFTDSMIGFAKAGPYLVALQRTGVLRTWDLRTIVPRAIAIDREGVPIAVDAERAWLLRNGKLFAVELASGKVGHVLPHDDSTLACTIPGRALIRIDEGRRLATREPARLDVLDLATGTSTTVPGTFDFAQCSPDHRWLGLASKTSVEIREAATPEKSGRTFYVPNGFRGMHLADHWLVVLDEKFEITRVELATGAVSKSLPIENISNLGIDARGRLAIAKANTIEIYSDLHATPTVIEGVVSSGIAASDVGFLIFTRSRELVVIDARNHVVRYDLGDEATALATRALRATITVDGKLGLLDLRDGSVIRTPWFARNAQISADGNLVVISEQFGRRLGLIRTRVPREPAALRAWIRTATNAVLETGSTQFTWRK